MKRRGRNGSEANYTGRDRRQVREAVGRAEFNTFAGDMGRRLDSQDVTLRRLDTAMFAKGSDNEHGVPGVMVVVQKIDQHIDVVCAWAKTARKVLKFGFWIIGALGTTAGALVAARAAGWM